MKTKKILIALWVMPLLLSSCRDVPEITPSPISRSTHHYQTEVLANENLDQITSILQVDIGQGEPIGVMRFNPDTAKLFVFLNLTGVLHHLDLVKQEITHVVELEKTGLTSASFDGTGQRLVRGSGMPESAWKPEDVVGDEGSRVWDTTTGELLLNTCEGFPTTCGNSLDVALSPEGKILTEMKSGAFYATWLVPTGEYLENTPIFINQPVDDKGEPIISTALTMDSVGEWIAYGTTEGHMAIVDPALDTYLPQETYNIGGHEWPRDIQFDPRRRYLAAVTDESFALWRLSNFRGRPPILHVPVSSGPAASVAFNPQGTLLAISTVDGWQVWSVETQTKLFEELDQPAYSITFSPDGQLIAVGGIDGVVHIWGVPVSSQ